MPGDGCRACGAPLTQDERAIYRRLVNRGAGDYLCKRCLAARFKCPETLIDEKIELYRQMGCTLFAPRRAARGE